MLCVFGVYLMWKLCHYGSNTAYAFVVASVVEVEVETVA